MEVSVIIPCYNEQATIRDLLMGLWNQTYPRDEMEVIIADGMSTDGTRGEIRRFQDQHPGFQVRLIDNPRRTIPAALNAALGAARGKYIVRLDAHAHPAEDYLARSITALEEGLGENVGGVVKMMPGQDTWVARSIAVAVSHPLGVGDARYRIGSDARAVDTVPFGAFRGSLIQEIGNFDETLLANEDYEFNVRIRQAGGTVWLDPDIQSTYVARSTLSELAAQYWRYGYWKLRMLVRYPETFRWRQLSGAFVLTWLVLGLLSIWFPLARWMLTLEAAVYLTALAYAGISSAVKYQDAVLTLGVPLAISTMHFSWGSGFLWSAGEVLLGQGRIVEDNGRR